MPSDDEDDNQPATDVRDSQSLSPSDNGTCASTLTLEADDSEDAGTGTGNPPRLVVAGRRKKEESMDDVKELTIQGHIGLSTTISLKFGNRKSKPQRLSTRAIQMRFDAYDGMKPAAGGEHEKTLESEIMNSFQCHPRKLTVMPGEIAVMNVSFSPDKLGVFSGALKIKSNKKVRLQYVNHSRYSVNK